MKNYTRHYFCIQKSPEKYLDLLGLSKLLQFQEFPALLSGQLEKNEKYKAEMTSDELMTFCLSTILDGQELLSGKIIMLECKLIPALISLYERF